MNELNVGDKAEITAVNAQGEIGSRLVDMGLVRGTRFKLIRKAPLGDPIEIMVKGFYLSLRLKEAETIKVIKVGEVGDHKPMGRGSFKKRFGRKH